MNISWCLIQNVAFVVPEVSTDVEPLDVEESIGLIQMANLCKCN